MLGAIARGVTKAVGRGGRRQLGGLAGIKDLINQGLISGGTTGVFTLAATGDPLQALAYGAADALGSTAAIGGTRRLVGTKRKRTYDIDPKTGMAVNGQTVIEPRKREMAANVAGSALASIPVTLAFTGAQPQVQGQQTQIAQQQTQRSVVNNQSPQQLAGKYFNNTMLQSVEGPSSRAQQVQASNAYFDSASAAAMMGSIVGV